MEATRSVTGSNETVGSRSPVAPWTPGGVEAGRDRAVSVEATNMVTEGPETAEAARIVTSIVAKGPPPTWALDHL